MSSSNFIRWCGLGCVLGSLIYAAGWVFLSLGVPAYWFDRVQAVLLVALLSSAMAALAAMACLYALREENENYRRIGVLVSLVTFVGVASLLVGLAIEALVGPPAQQGTPFEQGLGQLVPLFLLAGLMGTSVGLLVLAGLTLVSGRLPRWCGAMLIVGSPPIWVVLSAATADDRPELVAIPALAWVSVGHALFRAGIRQPQQSSRPS